MSASFLRYDGRDARGVGRGGSTTEEGSAELALRLFRAGWRSLRITRDGIVVGAIEKHPDTGVRMWWGASA